MKTAITGATGHLGANLVRILLEERRNIRVMVRDDLRGLEGLDVETIRGDVTDPASLMRLFSGADTVLHLAGRISITGTEDPDLSSINVEGVRKVVDACVESGVRRLVHVSSIHAVSTKPNEEVLDETRKLALGNHHKPYDRSKAAGQLEALKGIDRGLEVVVVNPTAIIGPHDFKVSAMGKVILDIYHHRLPALVDGGYNWVDVRDVAKAVLLAEKEGKSGESYLISGHWRSLLELAAYITRHTGKATSRTAIPYTAALFFSYFSGAFSRISGRPTNFNPFSMQSIRCHRFISHLKATRELGYVPRPFEETVEETMTWFDEAGMLDGARKSPIDSLR
ncbi:MAG: NAD-dependent epimerase/dehydratase family protein [bacterium]